MSVSSHRIRLVWRPVTPRSLISHTRRRRFHASLSKLDRPQHSQHDERPTPKAAVQSKVWAFVIGAGAAFAYAAYKRSRSQEPFFPSSDGFTKYTLVDKEQISSTCSIFTIAPLHGRKSAISDIDNPRSILSIQIKQPQLQIARSYTLLPPITEQPDNKIRLLIRREAKGEVSGYLHDIPVGSDIEVRGPSEDLSFPSDTTDVIFLAGGTGIAPALKTAAVLKESARVHVLWANRRREDCAGGVSDSPSGGSVSETAYALYAGTKALFGYSEHDRTVMQAQKSTLVQLLDILKLQAVATASSRLNVNYYVDDEQTYIRPGDVSRLINANTSPDPSTRLIIVSGPDGFIRHWAGQKEYVNGRQEQGALNGVLSNLNLHGWRVIKL